MNILSDNLFICQISVKIKHLYVGRQNITKKDIVNVFPEESISASTIFYTIR